MMDMVGLMGSSCLIVSFLVLVMAFLLAVCDDHGWLDGFELPDGQLLGLGHGVAS
jgi:hypothetical protein